MILEFPKFQEQGQHLPKSFQQTHAQGITFCGVVPSLGLMADCSSVSNVEEHEKHHL